MKGLDMAVEFEADLNFSFWIVCNAPNANV